jgi:hypothetical protein
MMGSFQSALVMPETQLGSWFEGWKNSSGSGGLVQTIVKTDIRINILIDSWLARAAYWLTVAIGLATSGLSIWLVFYKNCVGNALLLLAAALLLYCVGWGWRWLWTGRTDHLFSGRKYTAPGRVDEVRKNVISVFALLGF